jgi:hypothetical protein
MSILGNILSAAGFGQEEIKSVTVDTLKGVDENNNVLTRENREGVVIALREMLRVLRDGDVITSDTHRELGEKITRWGSKQKK